MKVIVSVVLLGLALWGFLTVREIFEKPLVELTLSNLVEVVFIGGLAYLAAAMGMKYWDSD